ncbi:BRCA1-associated protein [Drosophila persimilis]|uniref:BRCA1-associated protein n=1 Tax=Drosophila pseudoobscura pseudoobscura TaxID=46245 RepID=A0A6I8US06_DROPS|nr:BRCA1-associated protein [Drosophila pseudoobscura]XP_002019871.2 BRCA1-associated protein [Drosophila persimilis]
MLLLLENRISVQMDYLPENISLCVIKIEIDLEPNAEQEGAVSAEHPTNPRVQKERERDRGLRQSRDITIETYTNQRWIKELSEGENSIEGDTKKMNWATTLQHVNSPTAGSSRETTPRSGDESQSGNVQANSNFPLEIGYFSGNPIVEVTKGLIHLYKKNERKATKEAPSNQLCLLAVPATLNCHDLLNFIAPCHAEIKHVQIVRDGSPNQFMVLLEFRSNESALEFYKSYNGIAYNSLEPDSLCHAVWVSAVERSDHGLPPVGHTELPTCPVCLERMDESVDGVLTILCNHAFHASCLMKWGDSTCPVCRHVQTPELMEDSVCMECEGTDSLWICLICGHVGCGRYQGGHAAAHYRATNHTFAMQLGTSSVWDYAGDNFVHRLFQNKSDGKLVASQTGKDEREEKIDSMQMEFTYLLTSQLDTQRKYYEERMERLEEEWMNFKVNASEAKSEVTDLLHVQQSMHKEKQNLERKLVQHTSKLKEVQKQLNEERELSKALQDNQSSWLVKYNALEQQYTEFKAKHDAEVTDLKEQLRDVMFFLDTQGKMANSELAGASITGLGEKEPDTSTRRNNRRKK